MWLPPRRPAPGAIPFARWRVDAAPSRFYTGIAFPRENFERSATRGYGPGKERRVGDEPVSDRNAAIESQFRQLPAIGSPEYWARLEDVAPGTRLPLEVLARCVRERLEAGRRDQAERVYGLLWDRIQRSTRGHIRRRVEGAGHDTVGLTEDILQECAIGLWRDLAAEGPTFLTRGLWRRLKFMTQNAITQRLIEEGLLTRQGVKTPTRPPREGVDSLDRTAGPDDDRRRADLIPDPAGEDSYNWVATVEEIEALLAPLTASERLLIENEFTGELTQKQIGERLGGITDRAVRMRLEALRAKLRALRNKRDNPAGPGGGETSGEEEPR